MRAVLDKKVQGMRSQVMSFANDGVEVRENNCSAESDLFVRFP